MARAVPKQNRDTYTEIQMFVPNLAFRCVRILRGEETSALAWAECPCWVTSRPIRACLLQVSRCVTVDEGGHILRLIPCCVVTEVASNGNLQIKVHFVTSQDLAQR